MSRRAPQVTQDQPAPRPRRPVCEHRHPVGECPRCDRLKAIPETFRAVYQLAKAEAQRRAGNPPVEARGQARPAPGDAPRAEESSPNDAGSGLGNDARTPGPRPGCRCPNARYGYHRDDCPGGPR